jgi:hypothetical protein
MVQQEAADCCCLDHGHGVPGVRDGGAGLWLIKVLREMGLLSPDLLLMDLLSFNVDNKAAILLCKDRKKGQCSKHFDIIQHFAMDHVASGELICVLSVQK